MKCIIYGDDNVRSYEYLLSRKSQISQKEGIPIIELDFEKSPQISPEKLSESLSSGLFNEKKLVVIISISSAEGAKRKRFISEIQNAIKDAESDVIIYEHENIEKKKWLSSIYEGEVFDSFERVIFSPKTEREVILEIQERMHERGVDIDTRDAETLFHVSGGDIMRIMQNIHLLASFKNFSGNITEDDIKFVYSAEKIDPWKLPNILFKEDTSLALATLEEMLSGDDTPPEMIVGMIISEIRFFYRFVVARDAGSVNRPGVPYFKQRIYSSMRYTSSEIENILQITSEIDVSIKKGEISASDGVRMIIMKIT